jgi:valyl-tRNA synthetase
LDWMENLRDWNISRQNWWGIRVPVYYNSTGDKSKPDYIIASTEEEAQSVYGHDGYEAETDNFDTWFSSGQWPFATLMATGDFDKGFYPTSVMETGRDILFSWVTRMIMLGVFRTGEVPFRTVYLHGLVNDEKGRKMSKSKGNVINPLVMTDKYGTDALRLALTIGITPGNDGALSERKIEGYRNFANKLWNVARFILGQLPADYSPSEPELKTAADHWIQSKLDTTIVEVTKAIEDYRFSDAGQFVYSLLWDDFADWYLEASKIEPNYDVLVYGLETILKLLHPIAPFVTEAIWAQMPGANKQQLIITSWPVASVTRTKTRLSEVKLFNLVQSVVQAVRTVSAEEHLSKPQILTTDKQVLASAHLVTRLARASEVKLVEQGSGLYLGTQAPAWIAASTDQINARKYRLEKQLAEQQTYLSNLDSKLNNENYIKAAPESIVQESRNRRADTITVIDQLAEQLSNLG